MKRVLFYIEDDWAFGSIHHALCRELYKHGILASILDWRVPYSQQEIEMMDSVYDLWVTVPNNAVRILRDHHKISPNKIISIAHGEWDIIKARELDPSYYRGMRRFAVIGDWLRSRTVELGSERVPEIARIGIHCDLYDRLESPQRLSRVGYAGTMSTQDAAGNEIKRGHLVAEACARVGLEFSPATRLKNLSMPAYYSTVDAVIMSSTQEAGGLPMMEAAAAGRMCIGTPVGYFRDNAAHGAGFAVSIDPQQFVEDTAALLAFMRDNPEAYQNACQAQKRFARENYDWSVVIGDWLELLS